MKERKARIFRVITIFIVMIMGSSTPLLMGTASGQTPPPPLGDWIIYDDTEIVGENIVIRGNIIIENGGTLTLKNCELYIQSNLPGSRGIIVEKGGQMNCQNTIIGSSAPNTYYINVHGSIELAGCEVFWLYASGMNLFGKADGNFNDCYFHDNGPLGIAINILDNSTASIKNTEFTQNYFCIYTDHNSYVEVINCFLHNNTQRGIYAGGSSDVTIMNCIIENNALGIDCNDNATIIVDECNITDSERGIQLSEGPHLLLTNNYIARNAQSVACFEWGALSAYENNIENTSGIGIAGEENTNMELKNNCFNRCDQCILADGNGTFIIENNIMTAVSNGIRIQGNATALICNNQISGGEDAMRGLDCAGESYSQITENNITGFTVGIDISDYCTARIEYNELSDMKSHGVQSAEEGYGIVEGNIITYCKNNGIATYERSFIEANGNIISYCQFGAGSVESSRLNVSDNMFMNNDRGIGSLDASNMTVWNNTIVDSGEYGIISDLGIGGYLLAHDNEIFGSKIFGARITTKGKSRVILRNEMFSENENGIKVANGASPLIENCLFLDSANTGISVYDISSPLFYNCTISGSGDYDAWAADSSRFSLINTLLDLTKVHLANKDSRIDVGWWVDIHTVDEAGNDVNGANIKIFDNNGNAVTEKKSSLDVWMKGAVIIEKTLTSKGIDEHTPHTIKGSTEKMLGEIELDIRKNLLIELIMRIRENIDDEKNELDGGGWENNSNGIAPDLIIGFIRPTDGQSISGTVRIEINVGRPIDGFDLYYVQDGEAVHLFTGSKENKTYLWDTTQQEDGNYRLKIVAFNDTLGSVETSIEIIIHNEEPASATTVILVAAVGSATVIGAAVIAGGTKSSAVLSGGRGVKSASSISFGQMSKEGISEYAEEDLYRRGKKREKKGNTTLALAASAITLGIMFSLSETGSWEAKDIIRMLPAMLLSAGLVITAMEGVEALAIKKYGGNGSFSIWPLGILSLLITGILFKMPFGSPGKTLVNENNKQMGGAAALTKLLMALVLVPIFIGVKNLSYEDLGRVGAYTALMLCFFDAIPVQPLEGYRVWKWNKTLSITILATSFFLFYAWQLDIVGQAMFNLIGALALFGLLASLLYITPAPAPKRYTIKEPSVIVLNKIQATK